jgi:pteridine reductase
MDSISLRGKTALVTGASRRIGRSIAMSLASEGMNVIIHFNRSQKEASELCQSIKDQGVHSWTLSADFQKPEDYECLFERALHQAGAIDALINSASIFPVDTLSDLTLQSLRRNIEINAWVPFLLGRSFARLVDRGSIVNLVDSRIVNFDWNHVGYILSKHVLAALTTMMALEFAPSIAVNAVAPGLILPPPGKDEGYLDERAHTVPLRRHGDPRDIADAVVYLLKARFVTGETIYVDGGRNLKEYEIRQNSH